MSQKVDEKYFYDDKGELEEEKEEEEEDRKCPPQLVPSLKPDADYSLGAEAVDTAVAQKPEAIAIEEAVLFDEEEEIKAGADEHVFAASNDDRNTESHRAFGGQPDYSLGVEAVDTQGQPCPNATEQRRHHIQNRIFPGAYREGGPDIEEGYGEDDFTITIEEENEEQAPAVTRQKSIDPVSAELVNVAEEQRRLQEQIDQALERERQRAVVAEVVPVNDGDLPQSDAHKFGTKKRRWLVIGTILLIVVAITTALAVILSSNCGKDGYFGPNCDLYYPDCGAPTPEYIGNGYCDGKNFNTKECDWDGGDCVRCNDDGYGGPRCDLYLPLCEVRFPEYLGDGTCDGDSYNTTECAWDGGDCMPCPDGDCPPCDDGYFGPSCDLYYPNCNVIYPKLIGNGLCESIESNTEECGWDGGDCIGCNNGYFGPNCTLYYPNCSVPALESEYIGDGACYGFLPYYTEECGWEGGDCCAPDDSRPICEVTGYPNCSVPDPAFIGDGWCDGLPYNIEECGWDGGDCCEPGYFGPNCDLYFPNCNVSFTEYIGDGNCDIWTEVCDEDGCQAVMGNTEECAELIGDGYCDGVYNTTECGWEGGDCIPCNTSYFGLNCDLYYPNCSVPFPESEFIGDGFCNDMYNTTECGWEGGDCIPCNDGYFGIFCDLYYPNCSVPIPEWIGDSACDGLPYDVEECGWDGGDCPH